MPSTPLPICFFTDLGVSEVLSYLSPVLPSLSQLLHCIFNLFLNVITEAALTSLTHSALAAAGTGSLWHRENLRSLLTRGLPCSLHLAPNFLCKSNTMQQLPSVMCQSFQRNRQKHEKESLLSQCYRSFALWESWGQPGENSWKTVVQSWGCPHGAGLTKVQTTAKCFLWKTCLRSELWST